MERISTVNHPKERKASITRDQPACPETEEPGQLPIAISVDDVFSADEPHRYDHSVPTDGSGNTRGKCEDSIVISALRE